MLPVIVPGALFDSIEFILIFGICKYNKKMEEQQFAIPKNIRRLINKETAEHYLRMAEKELSHMVEVSNRTVERGYQLLSMLIAVLTGFGWVLSSDTKQILTTISMICVIVAFICCVIIAFKVISVHVVMGYGRMPKDMDITEFITYYHSLGLDKKQYINIIADEIESIQMRIDFNRKATQRRLYFFGLCLDLILIAIIVCGLLLISSTLCGK